MLFGTKEVRNIHTYIHAYIQAVQTWVEAIRDAVTQLIEERSNPNSHYQ
jgi:hypothetical protein